MQKLSPLFSLIPPKMGAASLSLGSISVTMMLNTVRESKTVTPATKEISIKKRLSRSVKARQTLRSTVQILLNLFGVPIVFNLMLFVLRFFHIVKLVLTHPATFWPYASRILKRSLSKVLCVAHNLST